MSQRNTASNTGEPLVSKTQQRKNRIAEKEEKANAQLLLIQQRKYVAEILRTKAIFRAISEEAATKAIIVCERIASEKEILQIKKEKKAEKEEQKAKQLEEAEKAFYEEIARKLSFYPEDYVKKHEHYCECKGCSDLPNNRSYVFAESFKGEIHIFLLPESVTHYNRYDFEKIEFVLKHKYQNLFSSFSYIYSKDELSNEIQFGNSYVFVGFDEETGKSSKLPKPPKPFDTHLNPDFWSGVNGCFTGPLQNLIKSFYESKNMSVAFKSEFYRTCSTIRDRNECYGDDHEDQCDIDCYLRPKKNSVYDLDKYTFGNVFIPFKVTQSCCKDNTTDCVLEGKISYKDNQIGIIIGDNCTYSEFYPLSNLNSLEIGKIHNGLFNLPTLCNTCEINERKITAKVEAIECFSNVRDYCSSVANFVRKFIYGSYGLKLKGTIHYPIRLITKDCINRCTHNSRLESKYGEYDEYGYAYGFDSYVESQCNDCNNVKRLCNGGYVLKVECKTFNMFKFPPQEKQIMPNYMIQIKTIFEDVDIEKMYVFYIIYKLNLPIDIAHLISKFISFDGAKKDSLIQLDSLTEPSYNLTLAKTMVKESKDFDIIHALVSKWY